MNGFAWTAACDASWWICAKVSAKRCNRLLHARLERAIGVIYRPETELASHYFEAHLPQQFDGYVWVEETHAVTPLPTEAKEGAPETYPFGL